MLQTSLVGPHRDDVYFEINTFPARSHGSQGQWRTAAVSIKLAMYELLRESKSAPPLLLLDEIFAELDSRRSQRLIELFGDFSQVFLTTAMEPPGSLKEQGRSFRIHEGKIEDIS
jgi:DNA replication and repair protein RecF